MCTRAAVVALHPDVAVVLGHSGLGVEEWKADTAFSAQAGIVTATLLNGVLIKLVAQPETGREQSVIKTSNPSVVQWLDAK